MTTVLLIRHGRTSANTAGLLVGRTSGIELDEARCPAGSRAGHSPCGRAAAGHCHLTADDAAGKRLRQSCQLSPTAVSSPSSRAWWSAAYGEWTGKSLRELSKDKLWSTVQQQPSAVRFPGGESMSEMSARAIAAVRDWDARMEAEQGPDAVWAAVSHGDVIKAILADALGMHLDSFQRIVVDPASISIVRYTAARPYLITANSTTVDLASLLVAAAQEGAQPSDEDLGRRSRGRRLGAAEVPTERAVTSQAPSAGTPAGMLCFAAHCAH